MLTKLTSGVIIFVVVVFILIIATFLFKAQQSRKSDIYRQNLSIDQAQLKPCSSKPNCVCSEYQDDKKHYIAPLHYQLGDAEIMQGMRAVIESMQGQIIIQNPDYIAVEFKSRWFGFVDDLEIRLDKASKLIHFRSASRQGYSDFNVNRDRVNELKSHF